MIVNAKTTKLLHQFIAQPSHALLLVGTPQSGVNELVLEVATRLHDAFGSVHRQLLPDGTSISIEAIRALRSEERLKTSATHTSIASIVSIVPIDAMQHEAQNALLKLLEEPPKGTLFILVCYDESNMLPTISSRCKRVDVLSVSLEQVSLVYGTQKNILQAYYMSGGEALLLDALITNQQHPMLESITHAKTILAAPLADKLQAVEQLVKERKVDQCLDALSRICRAALHVSTGSKQQTWAHNLKQIHLATTYIQAHVQPKLVLTNLFSSLE